jgi:hypothetical protein
MIISKLWWVGGGSPVAMALNRELYPKVATSSSLGKCGVIQLCRISISKDPVHNSKNGTQTGAQMSKTMYSAERYAIYCLNYMYFLCVLVLCTQVNMMFVMLL